MTPSRTRTVVDSGSTMDEAVEVRRIRPYTVCELSAEAGVFILSCYTSFSFRKADLFDRSWCKHRKCETRAVKSPSIHKQCPCDHVMERMISASI